MKLLLESGNGGSVILLSELNKFTGGSPATLGTEEGNPGFVVVASGIVSLKLGSIFSFDLSAATGGGILVWNVEILSFNFLSVPPEPVGLPLFPLLDDPFTGLSPSSSFLLEYRILVILVLLF